MQPIENYLTVHPCGVLRGTILVPLTPYVGEYNGKFNNKN